MANKKDIKRTIKKLIRINKIKMPVLSDDEKEELKKRIQIAIKQVQSGSA